MTEPESSEQNQPNGDPFAQSRKQAAELADAMPRSGGQDAAQTSADSRNVLLSPPDATERVYGFDPDAVVPNQRQQDKVVAVLDRSLGLDYEGTATREWDYTPLSKNVIPVSQLQRDRVSEALTNGRISDDHLDRLVNEGITRRVDSNPEDGPVVRGGNAPKVLEALADNGHARQILALVTRKNAQFEDNLTPADVSRLSERPTPRSARPILTAAAEFLGGNNPETQIAYRKAAHQLEQAVYGKQSEYWDQIQLMQQTARERKEG